MTEMLEFPDHLLCKITQHCNDLTLTRLGMTSRAMKQLVDSLEFWQEQCIRKWPHGDESSYQGHWQRMYSSRMCLPASLPSNIDAAHRVTVEAQAAVKSGPEGQCDHKLHTAFRKFLELALSIGLLTEASPAAKKSMEFAVHAADCQYWLEEHAQVVMATVREVNGQLVQYGVTRLGEAAWQRSALAFLQAATGSRPVHVSVRQRVQAECEMLDTNIKRSMEASGCSGMYGCRPPIGVPKAHWRRYTQH